MIYKILTSSFFPMEKLDKLRAGNFDFLLVDNIIYAAPQAASDGTAVTKKLKKIFSKDYLISEINDFTYESETARSWCLAKATSYSLIKMKEENQQELQQKINRLDEFEEYLKSTLNNNTNNTGGSK